MTTAAALAVAAQSLIRDALAVPLVPLLSILPSNCKLSTAAVMLKQLPRTHQFVSPQHLAEHLQIDLAELFHQILLLTAACYIPVRLKSHAGDVQSLALARDACADSKSAQEMAGLLQLYRGALALHAACAGIQPQVAPLPGQAIFPVRAYLMMLSFAECATHCTPLRTAAAIPAKSYRHHAVC